MINQKPFTAVSVALKTIGLSTMNALSSQPNLSQACEGQSHSNILVLACTLKPSLFKVLISEEESIGDNTLGQLLIVWNLRSKL